MQFRKIALAGLLGVLVTLGSTQGEVRADTSPQIIGEPGGSTAQQATCEGEVDNMRAHAAETIHFWYFTNDVRVDMRVWMNVKYRWCHDKPYRGKPYEVTGCYNFKGTKGLGPDAVFFRGLKMNPYFSEKVGGVVINPDPFVIDKRKDHNCETHAISKAKKAWMWIKDPRHRNQFNTKLRAHVVVKIWGKDDPEGSVGPKAMRPAYDTHVD